MLSRYSVPHSVRSWKSLAVCGSALVIAVLVYQPARIEGNSMAPLLSDHELIFINRVVYHFEPVQRGDVVVFWYPEDRTKSFIKRIVALPGETVEIRQGLVYIDGVWLPELYVPSQFEDLSDLGPVLVPSECYFVMGDHRNSSNDSRVFGPIDSRSIYGRAVFAYWPVDRFGSLSARRARSKNQMNTAHQTRAARGLPFLWSEALWLHLLPAVQRNATRLAMLGAGHRPTAGRHEGK
jgi:signal peptidase I